MHFDLTDLRLMVRVAEANSLTRGAEASHMSLPAASNRIKHLEESIGTKLLYRTSQGVTLTPPGQAFVHHAQRVLGQIEHLRGDLQEYAKGIKGHVRVYANTTASGEFLPPVLRAYLQSHPDVNIDLRERPSHDIVRAVSEGQVDIGIVAGIARTESLQVIAYRSDHLVLVVPTGHQLAKAKQVDFSDTLAFDHVGPQEGSAIHVFLRQVCDQLHRSRKLRIQVGNFETGMPDDRGSRSALASCRNRRRGAMRRRWRLRSCRCATNGRCERCRSACAVSTRCRPSRAIWSICSWPTRAKAWGLDSVGVGAGRADHRAPSIGLGLQPRASALRLVSLASGTISAPSSAMRCMTTGSFSAARSATVTLSSAVLRRALRRVDAVPHDDLEVFQPAFVECRRVGQRLDALRRRHAVQLDACLP